MAGNVKVIVGSLAANLGIAAAKGTAAFFTGSGSMLAESIHSLADCTNQVLLLIGVRESQKPPDDKHPLGRGKAAYFWSFLVALMLFSVGGMFSIYEGLHKLGLHEPVHDAWIGYLVLGVSIAIEAAAALQVGLAAFERLRDARLEPIDGLSERPPLVRRERPELRHQLGNAALFAEGGDAHTFNGIKIARGCDFPEKAAFEGGKIGDFSHCEPAFHMSSRLIPAQETRVRVGPERRQR